MPDARPRQARRARRFARAYRGGLPREPGRCGYRGVHAALKIDGTTVPEEAACRIMAEEELRACRPKKRRHGSCKGETGDAPENVVKRNLRADEPNRLWLADIAEFSIPAGKVYLSPIAD